MTSISFCTSLQTEVPDWRLQEILDVANDWALANGISSVVKSEKSDSEPRKVVTAPYSLFPTVVPAAILQQAKDSMVHFSRLMHAVAMDHEYLEQSLKNVIAVDSFMLNLWNIYIKVRESGLKQPLMLGLFRNDFMMNALCEVKPGQLVEAECLELKQIEFNAIASSFGGLIEQLCYLHRVTVQMAGKSCSQEQMPDNKPTTKFVDGLRKAWDLYAIPKAVILFIVNESETNIIDQRWIEFGIYKVNPRIRVIRKTLLDVYNNGRLDSQHNLIIDGDEVAVIYFRSGYTADSYPSQKEWEARLRMELSTAIKCPSVQHQLVGAKKIQQELTRPGALERFISDASIVRQLRVTFADQYSLDMDEEGDRAVQLALAEPHKFVLKPQREGGGNNLYGKDISDFFKEHQNSKERSAYILMQRIFPWQQKNYLVKRDVPFLLSDVVNELGIYGVFIGSPTSELVNYECGHMLRTKVEGTDEGGVATGFAVLDTPFVI